MSKALLLAVPFLVLWQPQLCVALPIQPPGLQLGDSYHWMFVTYGTRDALSTDIDDYNDFVRSQAAMNPSLTGTNEGVLWWAIGSTETMAAKDNAPVNGPVYLLDGSIFALDAASMWAPPNGTNILGTHAAYPEITQFGVERPLDADPLYTGPFVWTGTDLDGEAHAFSFLGASAGSQTWVGQYTSVLGSWISWGHISPGSHKPMYALSSPFKAEKDTTAVPEPPGLTLFATAIAVLTARRLRRSPCALSQHSRGDN